MGDWFESGMDIIGVSQSLINAMTVISILVGALECFAGFKIMKVMIAVWGFLFGASIGAIIGIANNSSVAVICLSLLLGIGIAALSYKLYLAGVFLLTAILSYLTIYMLSGSAIAAVIVAVLAGVVSVLFVRPVVIVSTAVSGAAILSVSACKLMGVGSYAQKPLLYILMIVIAAAGVMCQYLTTSAIKKKRRRPDTNNLTFSERKYPGMQRAYRNFCIQCGCELMGQDIKCPRCGLKITID